MFRRLIATTALSGLTFFILSIIGVLLVPVLVRGYGLVAFGLIALARLFLPTGVLSLVDLGVSEVAIQVTARARTDGSWHRCAAHLTLLVKLALGVGAAAAVLLAASSSAVTAAFHAPADLAAEFRQILLVTAAVLPVLFVSLVAEGVIKGFERYEVIRLLDVVSTSAYAGLAVFAVQQHYGYGFVCNTYIVTQLARSVVAITLALIILARQNLRPAKDSAEDRSDVFRRASVIVYGRLIGSLQGQAPPILIAMIAGPLGAGAFDILTKLPRVVKSVLGLINATLLPVTVRLDTAANKEGMRKLGETGLLVLVLATFPTATAAMVFSQSILHLWIGPAMAPLWAWQSLMFLQPVLMSIVSFGSTALLGRPVVAARLNRVATIQVAIQLGLSLTLSAYLAERAFIFGQILSLCITFPFSMSIIMREQDLSNRVYRWLATFVLVTGLTGGLVYWLRAPASILALMLETGLCMLVTVLIYWATLPNGDERKLLLRIPTELLGAAAGKLRRRAKA